MNTELPNFLIEAIAYHQKRICEVLGIREKVENLLEISELDLKFGQIEVNAIIETYLWVVSPKRLQSVKGAWKDLKNFEESLLKMNLAKIPESLIEDRATVREFGLKQIYRESIRNTNEMSINAWSASGSSQPPVLLDED